VRRHTPSTADRGRSRSVTPGPLDNLPRPLSERELGGRGRTARRVASVALVATVAALGVAIVPSRSPGPMTPVGEVQGAVATAGPSESPAAARPARPTAVATLGPVAVAPTEPAGPAAPESLEAYRWPLPKGRLTLPFGPSPWGSRLVEGSAFHDGIDLATFCGDKVVAAHEGTVLAAGRHYDKFMGWIGDLGPYLRRLDRKKLWSTLPIVVVVDDGNGYRSIYAHFGKVVVKKGATVAAGDLLGYEGATGRASGCHLHYGLFSPLEPGRFEIEPDVAKRMKLPAAQVARIDPLLVLPRRSKDPAPFVSAAPAPRGSAAPVVVP
jgi:murein DD-endopeptidase MepM/ murein hydrolase activator NlpD